VAAIVVVVVVDNTGGLVLLVLVLVLMRLQKQADGVGSVVVAPELRCLEDSRHHQSSVVRGFFLLCFVSVVLGRRTEGKLSLQATRKGRSASP